MQAGQKSSGFF